VLPTEYIRTILLKPFLCYEASIAYDGHTWELQVFFAIANQFPNEFAFLMNEGFASTEINLLHAFVDDQIPRAMKAGI
jgi:hypothetical protein